MRQLRARETLVKPLLVGEANPYGGDPEFALYPSPARCAGHRLCHLVMQLDPDDYLERFDRANLCPSRWSMRAARAGAASLRAERAAAGAVVVLLGARVCSAFGVEFRPFSLCFVAPTLVVLPHPSGLSRLWNEPYSYERARDVLRAAGAL